MGDTASRSPAVGPSRHARLDVNPERHCRTFVVGIPGSPGIAIGPAYLHTSEDLWVEAHQIDEGHVEDEVLRLRTALGEVVEDRKRLQERAQETVGQYEARIFESHAMLLEDPDLLDATIEIIRTDRRNAEYSYYVTFQKHIDLFAAMGKDNLFRERATDLEDIRSAVVAKLSGQTANSLHEVPDESIVVGHGLSPSDTAKMPHEKVVGFVIDTGGATSHASILARSLAIPAAVGCSGATLAVQPGDRLVLDGYRGRVYIDPDDELQDAVARWHEAEAIAAAEALARSIFPAKTTDGHGVDLELNIELPEEIDRASVCPGDGVGLFRTEFLFLARDDWPSEEEQFEVYKELAEKFGRRPVTLRTMDIGGDKLSSRLFAHQEMNPFLGWRAIRISLAQPEIFRTQLRAVLRASAHGVVRLMFPLVTSLDEFLEARRRLDEARDELDRRGQAYDPDMAVGVMIETPAAVIIAEALAKEADFFSIGTNDLVQYTLAVDRNSEHVAELFDSFHPAIIRLMRTTIEAGHEAGKKVYVCGEMAHDPLATMVLVGLGVDGLSMAFGDLPEIARVITEISLEEAKEVAQAALEQVTGRDVRALLTEALAGRADI